MTSKIDPREIPEVPTNRFLMRGGRDQDRDRNDNRRDRDRLLLIMICMKLNELLVRGINIDDSKKKDGWSSLNPFYNMRVSEFRSP